MGLGRRRPIKVRAWRLRCQGHAAVWSTVHRTPRSASSAIFCNKAALALSGSAIARCRYLTARPWFFAHNRSIRSSQPNRNRRPLLSLILAAQGSDISWRLASAPSSSYDLRRCLHAPGVPEGHEWAHPHSEFIYEAQTEQRQIPSGCSITRRIRTMTIRCAGLVSRDYFGTA